MTRDEWLDTLPKGSVGAEIGVAVAKFSEQMLKRVLPVRLYLVDRWALIENPGAKEKKELQMHAAMVRLAPYVARGIALPVCAWSEAASQWIPRETLDWVYIDADHGEESVYHDVCLWHGKVKIGGIVAGHDYVKDGQPYRGVARALARLGIAPEIHVVDEKSRAPSFWFRRDA